MLEQLQISEAVRELKGDKERGLSEKEAGKRLRAEGRNEMRGQRKKTLPESFLEQLCDPLIYVLLVAAMVSLWLKEFSDAIIIVAVVGFNALTGVLQEGKAKKALDALKKLTSPRAVVIREGRREEIEAAELVPGDLVCLEAGCQVPADLRLLEAVNLKIEEAALTGEALPVEKDADFLPGRKVPLGDRRNMAYMSTMVTGGRGQGIVTATGMKTEIGKIAEMISGTEEELTPLQKRLGELGKVLSILSLMLCAGLFLLAVVQKRNIGEMLITAISLAVAAVPEGLPAVVTICLALSVTRMVKVNTIIRRLPSVETLGAVSVVCTDKTGTLTQNKMTVEKCYVGGKLLDAADMAVEDYPDFFRGMLLCNDAVLEGKERLGDPTELALLEFGKKHGWKKQVLERQYPRTGELPFDSNRKRMTTCHGNISYTKGAPDEVLKRCIAMMREDGRYYPLTERERKQIGRRMEEMAGDALRMLAVARGGGENAGGEIREERLVFLGIVGMRDPARAEVPAAVAEFKLAGVKTVMITGDYADTAFAIGRQLGIAWEKKQCMTGEELAALSEKEAGERLSDVRIFARVSPAQKVQIVENFQKQGEIVAMTGDGVNDAPSLKKADIGIAMGQAGTDVARQAADMVLADDNFATIKKAIEEGRGVYENIRKSIIFLLSSNLGEIITMFAAVLCGLAAPLKSSHILWINLITDSLPALALGVDLNDGAALMRQKPRKAQESLFSRGGLSCTLFYGCLIGLISLAAFLMGPCMLLHARGERIHLESLSLLLRREEILTRAQTYAFTVLGMSQLYHAVGMRDVQCSVLRMNHLENVWMIFACVFGFLLQFAVTEVPLLVGWFGTASLSGREWLYLSVLAASPLFAHEIIALFFSSPGKGRH